MHPTLIAYLTIRPLNSGDGKNRGYLTLAVANNQYQEFGARNITFCAGNSHTSLNTVGCGRGGG